MNAFDWSGPSLYANDKTAKPGPDGLTHGQRVTRTVERITRLTGRNPGTVAGLSRKTHKRDTDTAWCRSNSGVG